MRVDEVGVDGELVRALVAEQFPQWAGLPVVGLRSAGTDNVMYRLGDDMVVRLPQGPESAHQVTKEQRWLPLLAPHLPLEVPVPLGLGQPGRGFAMPWAVYRWLDGTDLFDASSVDLVHAARELGGFVAALRKVDASGGPPSFRGGPVAAGDAEVRAAIDGLGADGELDARAATEVWEAVLRLPQWEGAPVWTHSDLQPGNLLARDGRLSAVIDFGGLGVGDPACDTMAAWTLFDAATRPLFREAAGVDDLTWARGRGWALCMGLVAEHHYRVTNPVLARAARRARVEALADAA